VYYEVYIASKAGFRAFDLDGLTYRCIVPRIDAGVETFEDGVRATDMERTVLDSINDFWKVSMDLEETLRCIYLIPGLDCRKLLSYLDSYNDGFLFQKTGYVLEHFREEFQLPGEFFDELRKRIPNGKRCFYKCIKRECHSENHKYNRDWRLFVPDDLLWITRKGVDYEAQI